MQAERWLLLLVFAATSIACSRPDPACGNGLEGCRTPEHICLYNRAYEFGEDGNPSPINFDSYKCLPMPEACSETPSCDCLTCQGDFALDGGLCQAGAPSFICEDHDGTLIFTNLHK
jgi:hypothetical protein